LKAIPDLLFEVDHSGRIFDYVAPKDEPLYVSPDEFLGKSIDEVIPIEAARIIHEALDDAFRNGMHRGSVYMLDLPKGPAWFELSIACKGKPGQTESRFVVTARNISDRKRAEEALRESEKRFRGLYENATVGMYRTSPEGQVLLANPSVVRMLGYETFEDLSGYNPEQEGFDPEHPRSEFRGQIEPRGEVRGLESAWRRKDGTTIFVRESASVVRDNDGKVRYYEGTVEDITERRLAEERIKSSLKEKEVLLQEIHHRVKNNLQIISGLLTLQENQTGQKPLAEIFRESQDRIRSIALIHEKLYRSQNLAEIDFSNYLQDLTESLLSSHGIAPGRIRARYEMEPIFFSIEKAIPLGLIANELVTNAMKHAFPEGRSGEIRIELRKIGDEDRGMPVYELVVADNGVGLPANFASQNQKSLGLYLVNLLVKQLNAGLQIDGTAGARFNIRFANAMKGLGAD
jgi:PAS domain S-box-containing protein